MGSEAEVEAEHEQSSMLKLTLFSFPAKEIQSPEQSGMLTPPLQTSAAVPFRWEQEPGKPRLSNALITTDINNKCLVLPPRLLTPSPYISSNRFRSPSFNMSSNCYGSLSADSKGLLGAMVLVRDTDGWFGSWRKKAFKVKREVGSHVFPSSDVTAESHNKLIKRSGSSSSLFHGKSHIWTRIREGMKQVVIPWRRSNKLKLKKDSLRL